MGRTLSSLTMQVALMPLGLVLTQALLISCSTRLLKLLFFQKATAVVTIVDLTHIKDYEGQREGAYARDKLNIRAIAPSESHFCLKVVFKKRGCILGSLRYANYVL